MTIIAACVDQDGNVWMGSDCVSISSHSDVRAGATSKVFRSGEMLMGSSGTIRCHQIAEHLNLPIIPSEQDAREWLIKEFIPPLQRAMRDGGGERKTHGGNDEMDARLLIALRGSLFVVDSGYGIWSPRTIFAAIGSADQLALAGMFTALSLIPEMHARAIVNCGLVVAAEYHTDIRPPFEIQCSDEESVAGIHAVA